MQADLFTKPTKANAVKQLFKDRHGQLVSNWDLNKITFRYGAVIHQLRKDGWLIDTINTDPKNGLYHFVYRGQI